MGSKRVNFRLPEDLIEEADAVAGVERKNRTDIVREAVQSYLDEVEGSEEFRERVVELYLDGEVGFDALADLIGRRDAEAVRASRDVLERGEALADEMADL